MRLAGIDIDAPPEIVMPAFLLALLGLSALLARLVRMATARWLGGPTDKRTDGREPTEAPKLAVPVAGVVLIGGLLLILPELTLPGRLGRWAGDTLQIALVFACALVLSRVVVAALTEYGARHATFGPALAVTRGTVRAGLAVLALITALQTLGVPVTPLLTTLGIGSLAVALALQDTLANFFAGLYLLADRPVGIGDYIKIHDGEEGYVDTIGWRSSRLRTLKGSVVVVPNQKLSQAILINFHRPTSTVVMTVSLTVAHGADVERVEAALAEELARAVQEVNELRDAKPVARLADLTDSGQIWQCIAEVANFEAQGPAGHALRKRLVTRLRAENIALGGPAAAKQPVPATAR